MNSDPVLSVNIAGIKLKNPLVAASGCYGYGKDYLHWISPEEWGAITLKGTTLHSKKGNLPPRLVETPSGLINSVGLQNPGVDAVLEEELPAMQGYDVAVLMNVSGETEEEYVLLADKLSSVPAVSGIEVNISCPNVEKGGLAFGEDPPMVEKLISRMRQKYAGPLIVKLSPHGSNLPEIARAAEKAGADAISLVNTLRAMVIDIEKNKPVLPQNVGGLSGPAIRPVAVRAVWEVSAAVNIPIIGMGGITCADDALQFILAGARAVAIGTANFINPQVVKETVSGLEEYMRQKGYKYVDEMSGAARR